MPTFDGANLTVTLDSGITELDVIDGIYEPWKDWMLASSANRKYPPAFRSDGGNPLNAIISQGSYIFLNNSAGWRIKPPEENITIYLTGNLAVEDSVLPAFVPTDGAFTAAILGLQPVTQGVTTTLIERLNYSAYNGGITYDAVNGDTLANYLLANIQIGGSVEYPLNNFTDAKTVQAAQGLPERLYVIGVASFGAGDTLTGWEVVGRSPTDDHCHTFAGGVLTDCRIRNCHVAGPFSGSVNMTNCWVAGVSGLNGELVECTLFTGGQTIAPGGALYLFDSRSGVAGDSTPFIDHSGDGVLQARGYIGGLEARNKTSGDASIDLSSGHFVVSSSCTGGKFVVRGSGRLTNNSGGAEVGSEGLTASDHNNIINRIESLRATHQAYGQLFYVDPILGNSGYGGKTTATAKPTITEALALCASGRNDVIVLLNQSGGQISHAEDVVINKDNVIIRAQTRDVILKPATPGGSVITVDGNHCAIEGLLIDGDKAGATTANYCITINGKFCLLNAVWLKQSVLDCLLIRGGDYHVIVDAEFEKASRHGIATEDAGLASGSPREITITGRSNIYLNGGDGIHIGANGAASLGTTTRLIRILSGEVERNAGYGIHADALVDGVTIASAVMVHNNTSGRVNLLSSAVNDNGLLVSDVAAMVRGQETINAANHERYSPDGTLYVRKIRSGGTAPDNAPITLTPE